MFSKIDVNGPNAHPVYQYLRFHSSLYDKDKQVAGEIPWNFAKFLVNADGQVTNYYGPQTDPDTIVPDIEALLK